MLYLPGGAFIHPITRSHWRLIHQLVRRTGAPVVVAAYGLAPDHTPDAAWKLATTLYRTLSETGTPVVVMGDSAGGNLALSLTQQWADSGLIPPARVVVISPWLDLTLSNPDIPSVAPSDPMLDAGGLRVAARWWTGESDPTEPEYSPVHLDYTDSPPVEIIIGTRDLFHPDARLLAARARERAWPLSVACYPGGFHVFPALVWLPESRRALTRMAALINGARS
ncbi:alpha/beta hydrolase fold domain-containing protein [Nocardia sp. NPDC050435]|uniref:alpha/beta hydrolase fold domain-containing protein n=1 Tax=Nocardia sp. NPDC050435 TaxID=3155040 RepID=UPI003403A420